MSPQLLLPSGVTVEVIVVNIVSAGHIFVQQHTHPTYHALRSLDQQMFLCYSQPGTPALPSPAEGGSPSLWTSSSAAMMGGVPAAHALSSLLQLVSSVQLLQGKEPGGELRSSPSTRRATRWRSDMWTTEATTESRSTHCGK